MYVSYLINLYFQEVELLPLLVSITFDRHDSLKYILLHFKGK